MHTEYEVKVLDIDVKAFSEQILELGAKLKGDYKFKRYVFRLANESEWIRLRTNGKLTTLTYKNAIKDSIDGVKELEVTVGNFEDTRQLLELAGLKAKTYEENDRVEYGYKNTSITIDTWPGIPSYAEIEGISKEAVEELVEELGLNNHKTTSKTVADIYSDYGVPMNNSVKS